MDSTSQLEDWRGVDLRQIRDLLQMSVAERAAEMIRVSNLMYEIRERAAGARERSSA